MGTRVTLILNSVLRFKYSIAIKYETIVRCESGTFGKKCARAGLDAVSENLEME